MDRRRLGILILLSILTSLNALWMILFPFHWYNHVPAHVPDFGPYNPHFVRDFGCAFLLVGIGILYGVINKKFRQPSILFALGFYGLHALTHIYDTTIGTIQAAHWLIDFPTTYMPVLLLIWIARTKNPAKLKFNPM